MPITTIGNQDLGPQTIDAFEIGYNGVVGRRLTLNASVYHQRSKGVINLTTAEFYGSAQSAAWMATPSARAGRTGFTETLPVAERGRICRSRDSRPGVDWPIAAGFSGSANYSFQSHPDVTGINGGAPPPVNIAPHHRVNLSLSGTHRRLVGSFTASYTDRAFWTDVLAIQGWTDRFWLIGATAGLNFKGDRFTWLVKGTNLADRPIQHHIFGDIIQRRVMTELRFRL